MYLERAVGPGGDHQLPQLGDPVQGDDVRRPGAAEVHLDAPVGAAGDRLRVRVLPEQGECLGEVPRASEPAGRTVDPGRRRGRSEEHTSELQSLMRISYAVF